MSNLRVSRRTVSVLSRMGKRATAGEHREKREELNQWLDENDAMVESVLVCCKRGLIHRLMTDTCLIAMPSGVSKVRGLSQTLLRKAILAMVPSLDPAILMSVSQRDPENLYRIFRLGTLQDKDSAVVHEWEPEWLEYCALLHSSHGCRLKDLQIDADGVPDFKACGVYAQKRGEDGSIVVNLIVHRPSGQQAMS
eukprot:11219514-Lingulodinium_polyedra.AAC.1